MSPQMYLIMQNKRYYANEQSDSIQTTFTQQVNTLVEVIRDMGNPFADESKELFKLDTKETTDPAVVEAVQKAEKT